MASVYHAGASFVAGQRRPIQGPTPADAAGSEGHARPTGPRSTRRPPSHGPWNLGRR